MRKAELLNLPKIQNQSGNLSIVESNEHIPFNIKRCYWIYDVPGGEVRGGHAFIEQHEFIVAISGSFDVVVNDGEHETRYHLNRSYKGLYVPNGYWRHMDNFSTNSIALVIASTFYDELDYIRNFEDYLKYKLAGTNYSKIQRSRLKNESIKPENTGKCSVLNLNKTHHEKGNITVIENLKHIPFNIERVYYLYDVPGGESRGGHAHKELHQLLIATGGSFDVILDDGKERQVVSLNRPYQALYIVPGTWRELVNFSSGATCLVLASHHYNEDDYIRDYDSFIEYLEKERYKEINQNDNYL